MASSLQLFANSYTANLQAVATQMGVSLTLLTILLAIVATWTLVWKGLSLWKASQKKQAIIFILLLVINDFGIIELLYFFWLSKIGQAKPKADDRKVVKQKSKKK